MRNGCLEPGENSPPQVRSGIGDVVTSSRRPWRHGRSRRASRASSSPLRFVAAHEQPALKARRRLGCSDITQRSPELRKSSLGNVALPISASAPSQNVKLEASSPKRSLHDREAAPFQDCPFERAGRLEVLARSAHETLGKNGSDSRIRTVPRYR